MRAGVAPAPQSWRLIIVFCGFAVTAEVFFRKRHRKFAAFSTQLIRTGRIDRLLLSWSASGITRHA
ncbi:Hypothetical protein BN69_0539 [Methylocystis sp. SC2]|nr:Hypothetical protein BN69_0539 [Methylocystis sp. SC2]